MFPLAELLGLGVSLAVIDVLAGGDANHGYDVPREHAGPATAERPKVEVTKKPGRGQARQQSCRPKTMVGR
jgi:hypothetical protein